MTVMEYSPSIVHDRIGAHFVAVLSLLAPFTSRARTIERAIRIKDEMVPAICELMSSLYRDSGVEHRDLASNWTSRELTLGS